MRNFLLALIFSAQSVAAQDFEFAYPECYNAADIPKYKDSIAYYSELILCYPDSATLYSHRAYYKAGIKDLSGSVEDYLKTLAKDSAYHSAWYSLGVDYAFLKKYKVAETYLRRALQLGPNDSDAKYLLGLVLFEQENYAEGVYYFTTCHHVGEFAINAKEMVVTGCLELENYSTALTYTDSLLFINSSKARYLCLKARALGGLKKYAPALYYFQKCLDEHPYYTDAFYYRASLKEDMGHKKAACEDYYQGAIRGDKDCREVLCDECKKWCGKLNR